MITNHDRKSFGSCWAEKIPEVAQTTGTVDVQAFQDSLCRELPHVKIFMIGGPNLLTWDAQFLNYCFSWNPAVFQDYLSNLISNLWGGHWFVLSRSRHITDGKITMFKLGHPAFLWWHTMVHVPLMFVSKWREFPLAPSLAGKIYLMTAYVSVLLKSRTLPDMLHFSPCNKKRLAIRHMNRLLFLTTLSIPFYNIGK